MTISSSSTTRSLTAEPSKVVTQEGIGTTTISWQVTAGIGHVYVSQNGRQESLFASGTSGHQDAPWIYAGSSYEFILYANEDLSIPVASITVIGEVAPDELLTRDIDIAAIRTRAGAFQSLMDVQKGKIRDGPDFWYEYNTYANLEHLDHLLTGTHRQLLQLPGDKPVVDLGAADGDMAFLLESFGLQVDAVEFAGINNNQVQGIKVLRDALHSSVRIIEQDLDEGLDLPEPRYGLALLFGVLYHLKNPYGVLERIARYAEYLLLSTRIMRFFPSKRVDVSSEPLAYLVDACETNNDFSNTWMFTEAGLRRLLHRTGWNVLELITVGNTLNSDPVSADGDERAFCLLERKRT